MSTAQISKAFQEEKELHHLKSRLIQFLAATNDIKVIKKFDKLLFKLIEVDEDNEIVGRTSSGKLITRKELDLRFEISFEQIRNGQTISLEDAEKRSGNMAIIVEFTRHAILDIKEILDYIKEISTAERARKVRKEIFDATKRLENHPQLGKLDEKRRNKKVEIRYIIHKPYRVYYQVTEHKIFVIEIIDSRKA